MFLSNATGELSQKCRKDIVEAEYVHELFEHVHELFEYVHELFEYVHELFEQHI